jgi:hypothetical protein
MIIQYSDPGNVFQLFWSRKEVTFTYNLESLNIKSSTRLAYFRLSIGCAKAYCHVRWDIWNQFLRLGSSRVGHHQNETKSVQLFYVNCWGETELVYRNVRTNEMRLNYITVILKHLLCWAWISITVMRSWQDVNVWRRKSLRNPQQI